MWLTLGAFCWFLWALVCEWLSRNPRAPDLDAGFLFRLVQLHARVVHSLRVEGREHLPRSPGPMIVVANHTAGIDPLLIQSACRVEIRWLMAKDMMPPRWDEFWRFAAVIPVDRTGKDMAAVRAALRHLKSGGVIGIFPEGALERPPRHILPFFPGVGIIAARAGAPVLPIVIDGTPQVETAYASIFRPSRSRLRVMPPITYDDGDPLAITQDLERRFKEWTGWPSAPRREDLFQPE